jgi:type III secretion protein HrpB1
VDDRAAAPTAGEHPTLAAAREMVAAIRDGRLDEAEQMLEALRPQVPQPQAFLVFPVIIAIQRGQVLEALQHLNAHDEDDVAELKALCLQLLGDARWHALATQALESPDPHVRRAMQALCGLPLEALAEAIDGPAPAVEMPYGAHIRA